MKPEPSPSAGLPHKKSTDAEASAPGPRDGVRASPETEALLTRIASRLKHAKSQADPAQKKGAKLRKSGRPSLETIEEDEASPAWDQAFPDQVPPAKSPRSRWRSMLLMLLGTGLLAGAWIIYASLEGRARIDQEAQAVPPASDLEDLPDDEVLPEDLVENATAAMDAFLRADTLEGKLRTVRDPERVGADMRRYYATHDLEVEALEALILLARQRRHGMEYFVAKIVTTRGGEEHFVLFQDATEKFVVDWETFVGYNPISWDVLMIERPVKPMLLRAYARRGHYHNYAFRDRRRYHCVELEEPRGDRILFGYVDATTENGMALIRGLMKATRKIPVTVEAAYPEAPMSDNQVAISRFLRFSWITPPEETATD